MKNIILIILAVVLIVILMSASRKSFEDLAKDLAKDLAEPEATQDPRDLLKRAREILQKYDTPESWNHATSVMFKDPGELARLNLGIQNNT